MALDAGHPATLICIPVTGLQTVVTVLLPVLLWGSEKTDPQLRQGLVPLPDPVPCAVFTVVRQTGCLSWPTGAETGWVS